MLRQIYHRSLPASVRRGVRRLIVGEPPLSVHYDLADEWPAGGHSTWLLPPVTARFKSGQETFDFDAARRSPETACQSPIVQDNLTFLRRTDLTNAKLLDFGCGNGLYRLILAHHPATARWEYVGADVNREVIEWCREAHSGTRFETVEQNTALPFRVGEFDVVLVSGVIQCIADHAATLSELRRVAGGYVLVSRLPLWKHHPSRVVLQHVRHAWGQECHPIHISNRDALEELFDSLGFSILQRDYGSECFQVAGVSEPVIHNQYLLKKI